MYFYIKDNTHVTNNSESMILTSLSSDRIDKLRIIEKLSLTGIDANFISIELLKKERFRQECIARQRFFNLLKFQSNTYAKYTDYLGKAKVFYSKDGIIYLAKCKKINELNVKKLDECIHDIPVEFMPKIEANSNQSYHGYLTVDLIIRPDKVKYNYKCDLKSFELKRYGLKLYFNNYITLRLL